MKSNTTTQRRRVRELDLGIEERAERLRHRIERREIAPIPDDLSLSV
jgi:hypothetical protein